MNSNSELMHNLILSFCNDAEAHVNKISEQVEACFKEFWKIFFKEDIESDFEEKQNKVVVSPSPSYGDNTLTISYLGVPVAKILIVNEYAERIESDPSGFTFSTEKTLSKTNVSLKML